LEEARGQIPPAVLVEEGVQEVPVDLAVLREQERPIGTLPYFSENYTWKSPYFSKRRKGE
jgi:hypothetical protein